MPTIIDSGSKRNLTTIPTRDGLVPNPDERRFVTFINELGSLHTIIVDADHAAQDAESLLKWFEQTKAAVETSHSDPTSDHFRTPERVLQIADTALGFNKPNEGDRSDGGEGGPTSDHTQQRTEGY